MNASTKQSVKARSEAATMAFGYKVVAALMATLLIACLQCTPFCDACAAESKATSSATESAKTTKEKSDKNSSKSSGSSKKGSGTLTTPDKKKNSTSKDDDEEKGEEDKRDGTIASLKAAAESLHEQARTAQATYEAAQNEYTEAENALEKANTALNDAEAEYKEKSAEIVELQETLADYAVDMYKQGGAVPYLDVMLGARSYREFLTSWNMTITVTSYGSNLVTEKKRIREAIETKISTCKETVKEAEKSKDLADTNRRQANATRLALLASAAQTELEAAKLANDDDAIKEAEDAYREAQDELDDAIAKGLAGGSQLSGTGLFTHPCPNYSTISSGFGYRAFDNAVHQGIDYAAPEGTLYYAADSGTVTAATNGGGYNGGAGNWVVIDHGNGLVTKYMHSLVTFVSVGDHVERGQNIGLVGTTGNSTGPHLHFQVEAKGVAVNPTSYL